MTLPILALVGVVPITVIVLLIFYPREVVRTIKLLVDTLRDKPPDAG